MESATGNAVFAPKKNNPGHKTGGLTFPKNPKNLANFAN